MTLTSNNLPEYARTHKYVVYRTVDGENWFWGAFDDVKEAFRIAKEIDGALCSVIDDL